MKVFILASMGVMLAACTYHSATDDQLNPLTYTAETERDANSIGLLRRLAIMPIDIETVSDDNATEIDLTERAADYEVSCAAYLTNVKGYDIVIARQTDSLWQNALSAEERNDGITDLYALWRNRDQGERTESMVRKIGRAMDVDGLIVIQVKERKPWDAVDGIMNIFLMNIPLIYQMRKPSIGALIYETISGKMVWQTEQSTFGSEATLPDRVLTGLFFNMDNAVPPQLIK